MDLRKTLILIPGIIILIFTGYFYRQQALSFKFVDEEDNFAIGKYVSTGEKIYDDIISNHQPLTYVLSSYVQKLARPNNGYFLIVRHREALITWAMIWSLFLIYIFGWAGLIFIIIYELTKIYLLGNLFLAESLVVYPLLYLLGMFLQKKLTNFQIFIWGISFFLVFFLLSPIWPCLFFLLAVIIFRHRQNLFNFTKFFLSAAILVISLITIYQNWLGYFYYTFFVNLTYTIPGYQNDQPVSNLAKSILSPFLSFLSAPQTPTLVITRLFSLVLILNCKKLFLIFLVLGLLNIRFINPGTEGYSGFHILPWYAALVFLSALGAIDLIKNRGQLKLKIIFGIFFGVAIFQSIKTADTLFRKVDSIKSYNINYSTHLSIGDVVKNIKGKKDTLFVSPNASLVYWQADIAHLPKLYGDYTWMSGFPPLNQKVTQVFENNPPTFFYCENCKGLALEKYLEKYKQFEKEGAPTNLYILKGKAD